MSSKVKVAVRVRPMNKRGMPPETAMVGNAGFTFPFLVEFDLCTRVVVDMDGNQTVLDRSVRGRVSSWRWSTGLYSLVSFLLPLPPTSSPPPPLPLPVIGDPGRLELSTCSVFMCVLFKGHFDVQL